MSPPLTLPLIPLPGWLNALQGAASLGVLDSVAHAVNPSSSTINCGHIIDAAIDRLTGANPSAVAPPGMDGGWGDIEARHHTSLTWGSNFGDAFHAVQNGGPGTIAIVGIGYSGGHGSHVVALANQNGTVGIIEGQDWGAGNPREVITDPAQADSRYNSDGHSNIGWGIVGSNP